MIRIALLFILSAPVAMAEVIVAARTIPAQAIIIAEDLQSRDVSANGAATVPSELVGKEARVALFAGRPIYLSDVGVPAVVERNQIIPLIYDSPRLIIETDGRALDRGGPGEVIRVMNLQSRTTVTAKLDGFGVARVTP